MRRHERRTRVAAQQGKDCSVRLPNPRVIATVVWLKDMRWPPDAIAKCARMLAKSDSDSYWLAAGPGERSRRVDDVLSATVVTGHNSR
jgi:hypothetical protein